MARSDGQDGVRRRGGALFGELRRLELMRESGSLSDEAYRAARARMMRSVSEADLVDDAAPETLPAAPRPGAGALLTLGAVGLGAVAMLGATTAALMWISVAGLATVALAACWDA